MTNGKIIAIVLATCAAAGFLSIAACAGLLYVGFNSANASVSPSIDELFAAIEDGTFADTYDTKTAKEFRQITSKEQYSQIGKAIATRLGPLKAKTMKSFNMRRINASSFADVTYDATFENDTGVIAARMKKEGGEWKLVSFRVNSPAFERDLATEKCAKCGAPHSSDARFCPSCGVEIQSDDSPQDATRGVGPNN